MNTLLNAPPTLGIDVNGLALEPIGASTGADPDSCLKGTLRLLSHAGECSMHVYLIEVRDEGDGCWSAVDPERQFDLDTVHALTADAVTTLRYRGSHYVPVLFPYAP